MPSVRPRPRFGRRRREGAAAPEFALVALPFFGMMFAVMELGVIFLVDSVLENAVVETSRIVRTGQAANAAVSASEFRDELCARMSVFEHDCYSRANVDVRVLPQFRNPNAPGPNPNAPNPISNGQMNREGLQFNPGQPGNLVLVRVWYAQPLIMPGFSQALTRLSSGETVLKVATAFRNEPFTIAPPGNPPAIP